MSNRSTYLMDEESCKFLEDFKKKHRYPKSQVLRTLAKYYKDRESKLLRIMEREPTDD